MNIAFFIRHFTERGTEVSVYDYAKYNEDLLKNKSYIICFTKKKQQMINFPTVRISYDKFNSRFPIIEIDNISDMKNIIDKYNLSFFYTQTGGGNDIYQFENKNIWRNCKTIKHCVFSTNYPEGDFYISIGYDIIRQYSTTVPVIPYMVDLPICNNNLRDDLKIPINATVIGNYGGKDSFNIPIAHEAIKDYLNTDPNTYFLFMNTNNFYNHSKIIYLEGTTDLIRKTKFINTCDAMIHARDIGETFGLAVAEFSIKNKPIITCASGNIEHLRILKDKAIIFKSKETLIYIFMNIKNIIKSRNDWNAYEDYSPEKIMKLFNELIFSK